MKPVKKTKETKPKLPIVKDKSELNGEKTDEGAKDVKDLKIRRSLVKRSDENKEAKGKQSGSENSLSIHSRLGLPRDLWKWFV